jgi:hypothetical protein
MKCLKPIRPDLVEQVIDSLLSEGMSNLMSDESLRAYARWAFQKQNLSKRELEMLGWDIKQNLEALAHELQHGEGTKALNFGSYRYWPIKGSLRRWRASDGSELKVHDFLEIFMWAEKWDAQALRDYAPDEVVRGFICLPKDQASHEAETL